MNSLARFVAVIGAILATASANPHRTDGFDKPYRILKSVQVGGDGGYDYVFADDLGRRLYVPRTGVHGRLATFDLDTLEPKGTIEGLDAGGVAVDPRSHHGFSTTKPLTMFDTDTLKVIRNIPVDGRPDGIIVDSFNHRVWVLSHVPPYGTVIDARSGKVVGTVDLGGAPEQAVSDGKGTVYVNISDKHEVAVVDARRLIVRKQLKVPPTLARGSGLSLDKKTGVLFAYYRAPSPTAVMIKAATGAILDILPTGARVDTTAFNAMTNEAISAEGAGSMTFIKETSAGFFVRQTLKTMLDAKSLTLDEKTGRLFTVSAKFGPAPPNATATRGGRPPRGPMLPDSFTILMVGK